jgi:hypothetical protein
VKNVFRAIPIAVLWCVSASSAQAALTVDAGPTPYTLDFPTKDLTLYGHVTNSTNAPIAVQWTVSGPASVRFSNAQALFTTVTFSQTGTYTFQLTINDGTASTSATASVTVNPASSQTAFYVDTDYTGLITDGSAARPWTDPSQVDWRGSILTALATNDVIVYFSARHAGSDSPESSSTTVWVNRPGHCGYPNTPSPCDSTTGTHRLTVDGMSLYNADTTHVAPNWVPNSGTSKFKIVPPPTNGGIALGWDDDVKRDYITLRGFEVTGTCGRVVWGGNYTVVEYLWSHDISGPLANCGPQVIHSGAVGDPRVGCPDLGKVTGITVRNNLVERGIDEGLYIAGNYLLPIFGGCPPYGNTHHDVLIEGNTVADPGSVGGEGDGLDLKAGLINVTVRGNRFLNNHNSGEGVLNWNGTFNKVAENYLIENNVVTGSTGVGGYAIGGGNSHAVIIRNNVIYNNAGGGINLISDPSFPGDAILVYNNTLYGNAGGGIFIAYDSGVSSKNNLIFGNGTGNQILDSGGNTDIISDYNLLAPTCSDFPEGTHSICQTSTADLVANPSTGGFHLIAGSPAIDKGLDLSVLANLAAGGIAFNKDFDDVTRPQGSGWDIGAYEYSPGGAGSDGGSGGDGGVGNTTSAKSGCGCSGGGFNLGITWILLLAALLAYRLRLSRH